jgi:2-hydroxychromene-2-carboxylate isomerase
LTVARLEFFFDCSSPRTYLGFVRIQPLAAEYSVDIEWKPFLVGGVFNAVNRGVYEARANMLTWQNPTGDFPGESLWVE